VVQGDWQSIEAEKAFTFKAPPDLQPEQVQGIDSFIGRYVSQSMTVSFDYGWYSDPMDREGFDRSSTTIDGRRAYIVRKSDVMGVHFPEVQGDTKLTMRAELHGADPETIETIFRTIDFPE
jgi:hypothetical protein